MEYEGVKAVSFGFAGQGSAIMRGPMVSGAPPLLGAWLWLTCRVLVCLATTAGRWRRLQPAALQPADAAGGVPASQAWEQLSIMPPLLRTSPCPASLQAWPNSR